MGRVLHFLALLTRRTAPFLNGLGTNPNKLDGANSTEENNPKLRREVPYLFLFSWVRGCVWNRECPPGTHIPGGHSFGGRNQGKELKPLIPATASQPAFIAGSLCYAAVRCTASASYRGRTQSRNAAHSGSSSAKARSRSATSYAVVGSVTPSMIPVMRALWSGSVL